LYDLFAVKVDTDRRQEMMMMTKILSVRNLEQAALFELELRGQISDGKWENVPGDHWQPWCDATVVVAEDDQPVGRNFAHYSFRPYNFAAKDLLDVVGQRMLYTARVARTFGLEFARRLQGLYIMDINDGIVSFDWEPTAAGKYFDDKRAAIADLLNEYSREAIAQAATSNSYTMTDMRKDLRDLSKLIRIKY
jgi:hypothetical protein